MRQQAGIPARMIVTDQAGAAADLTGAQYAQVMGAYSAFQHRVKTSIIQVHSERASLPGGGQVEMRHSFGANTVRVMVPKPVVVAPKPVVVTPSFFRIYIIVRHSYEAFSDSGGGYSGNGLSGSLSISASTLDAAPVIKSASTSFEAQVFSQQFSANAQIQFINNSIKLSCDLFFGSPELFEDRITMTLNDVSADIYISMANSIEAHNSGYYELVATGVGPVKNAIRGTSFSISYSSDMSAISIT